MSVLPITNESELNQALWALPPEGGVVEFSGTISITSTIVLGNGSELQRSDYNGITLRGLGSGVAELDMGQDKSSSPSKLVWNGPLGGTMIQFAGPVSGITLENLQLDCNHLASTAIDSVRSFNNTVSNLIIRNWTNGFAIKIHANTLFNGHGLGGGGAPHHCLYSMIYITDPGLNASCIQVAVNGGNVNQVLFQKCTCYYSPDADSVGLDLGLTDHISFVSCFFAISEGVGGNSIQVTPPVDYPTYNSWPQNITFYDTPISGGIKLNGNWEKRINPALLFYPYYTADGQSIPPVSSQINAPLLPIGLVSGYTDQGERLGLLARGESRIIFSNQTSSIPITNQNNDHIYFYPNGSIYSDLFQTNSTLRLKASGRITKPIGTTQTFEIRFYFNNTYLSAAHTTITATLDGYLWHASCEVTMTGKINIENPEDPTTTIDKLVMRRNGGNLFISFCNHASSWAPGIFGLIPDNSGKITAQVSAKWHNLLPENCSVVMDSFICEMFQG